MNIKTFLQCVQYLPPGKSVMIRGDHGIGKSQIVRKVGRVLNKPVTDRRLSQMTEGDIIGLPFKKERARGGESTSFAPMDWFLECCEEPRILFLDEGNRASGEVIQGAFQIALDRELNGNKLHQDSQVFMAVNHDPAKYQVNQFDPAFLSRWWVCDLEPTVEEWLEYAKDQGPEGGCVHKHITGFIELSATSLDPQDGADPQERQPDRRSWCSFNEVYQNNKMYDWNLASQENQTLLMQVAAGFVGHVVAQAFVDFAKAQERFLTPNDILDSWDDNEQRILSLSQGEQNKLNSQMVDWFKENIITEAQAGHGFKNWCANLPGELLAAFWMDIAKTPDKTATNLKLFHKYIYPMILAGVNNTQKAASGGQ